MKKIKINFQNAKYNFDVSKADKTFNILLKDKYIVLTEGYKVFPVEQRKG